MRKSHYVPSKKIYGQLKKLRSKQKCFVNFGTYEEFKEACRLMRKIEDEKRNVSTAALQSNTLGSDPKKQV